MCLIEVLFWYSLHVLGKADLSLNVKGDLWPSCEDEMERGCCAYLQVKQFSCKSVEMSLRVASLDYLGIVAARLRRDAVSSRLNEDVIYGIIKQVCITRTSW